jgi:energy-coupling factor transporter ATP-binding protein EcfA2
MKIRSFRVWKYRNIEDSCDIELLDNLTCIVGKNQSGKTALLRALHKFNPHEPAPYDMRREWPRGQRTAQNKNQVVCAVRFELEDEERERLAELTQESMTAKEVVITKDYGGEFEVQFPEQPDLFPDALHPNDIDSACEAFVETDEQVGETFAAAARECIEEAKRFAREGRFEELSTLRTTQTARLQASFTPGNPHPQHQLEQQFLQTYTEKLKQVEGALGEALTMHQRAHEYLVKRIPVFIYMADYKSFQGRAEIEAIKQKQGNPKVPLTEEDETFLMILKLAGLDLDQLIKQGASKNVNILHDRQLDLQDAATTLTRGVAGRWGQNEYRIEFRTDGQVFFTDIEEVGKDIGMIPLEEQSKGFQWFFSFDLHFMHDSNGTFEGCVLLLDEPGLHLHPGGQADLLARLDAYAAKNTTIYTTHLPFLVDLREPARIKVINQDAGGAVVSADLGASQRDERLTLQAALGMRANQSYLIADRNVVVEGPGDYWITTELSNALQRSGEDGLPDDVMVTAAGSASELVHMATFMIGQELQVVALFDSDEAGRKEEDRLRTKWLTRYKTSRSATLLLGHAVGVDDQDFTLEDLFPDDYYLSKVQESHAMKLKAIGKCASDLTLLGRGPILPRVQRACDALGVEFNKGSVAKLIRRELVKANADGLPKGTAEKARKLVAAIRKALGDNSR